MRWQNAVFNRRIRWPTQGRNEQAQFKSTSYQRHAFQRIRRLRSVYVIFDVHFTLEGIFLSLFAAFRARFSSAFRSAAASFSARRPRSSGSRFGSPKSSVSRSRTGHCPPCATDDASIAVAAANIKFILLVAMSLAHVTVVPSNIPLHRIGRKRPPGELLRYVSLQRSQGRCA